MTLLYTNNLHSFSAHANYWTWSIDFGSHWSKRETHFDFNNLINNQKYGLCLFIHNTLMLALKHFLHGQQS